MISMQSRQRQRELGDFVRVQRERLKPADVGLPAGPRRRTSGLRREEVAQLCGLSVTWYTWLEQGRDMVLSAAALARLARALRLGRAERAYLFELAGKRDPNQGEGDLNLIPATTLASVDLIAAPAYILDRSWTARSWNRAAERLFVGWLNTATDRNLLRFIFLEPAARSLISDLEARARRIVAEFRADVSAHPDDPAVRALVGDLRSQSQDFERFWDEHGVLGREGGERTFNHPRDGLVRYQQVTFLLAGHTDFKLTMLIPS